MKQFNLKAYNKIFFPAIACLAVILTVFSFLFSQGVFNSSPVKTSSVLAVVEKIGGPRNTGTAADNARKVIVDTLKDTLHITQKTAVGADSDTVSFDGTDPTFVVHNGELTTQERRDAGADTYYVNSKYNSIIVIVPATTGSAQGAAVVMTPYDTLQNDTGAADNAVVVGAMIETIRLLKDTADRKNDVVFVFTDGIDSGSSGAYAFFNKFKGFNNVVARLDFAVNYDLNGNKGNLVVSKMSDKNQSLLKAAYNSGFSFNSIDDYFSEKIVPLNDFAAATVPAVNVSASGRQNSGIVLDSKDNLSKSFVKKVASSVYGAACYAAKGSLQDAKYTKDFVYFSYLGINISYSKLAAQLLTIITGVLLAAVIAFNFLKKAFSWIGAGKGAAIALLSILATAISVFIVYVLVALIMSGFGVISIYSMFSLSFSSAGFIVGLMIAAVSAMIGFTTLFKKLFNEKSTGVMAGSSIITAVTAIFMGIFLPELSFALVAYSTLQLAVLAVTIFVKAGFKEKNGFDINRLVLGIVPFVIALPLIIASLVSLGTALGATYYLVSFIFFALILSALTPFFTMLDPVLDGVAKKLPPRSVRVLSYQEKTITVDKKPAAKGAVPSKAHKAAKPETKKVMAKNITIEKRPLNYKTSFAVTVLAVCSAIVILFSTIGVNAKSDYTVSASGDAFYSNAMVYKIDRDTDSAEWVIKDNYVAGKVSGVLSGIDYKDGAYTISDNESKSESSNPNILGTTFVPFSIDSRIVLDITFKETVPASLKIVSGGKEIFNVVLFSSNKTLRVILPDVDNGFMLRAASAVSATIVYTEYVTNHQSLKSNTNFKKAVKEMPELTANVVLTKTFSDFSIVAG